MSGKLTPLTVANRRRSCGYFDVVKFHTALDLIRIGLCLDWKSVAHQTGVPASTLTRMGQGKRPCADHLTRLVWWGSLDLRDFIYPTGD